MASEEKTHGLGDGGDPTAGGPPRAPAGPATSDGGRDGPAVVPDLVLERYLAGDLGDARRAAFEASLAASPELRARLEALRAERTAFVAAHPPGPFAHRVAVRLSVEARPENQRRARWARFAAYFAAPPVVAAAVLLLAVTYSRMTGDAPSLSDPVPSAARDGDPGWAEEAPAAEPAPASPPPIAPSSSAPAPDAGAAPVPLRAETAKPAEPVDRLDRRAADDERGAGSYLFEARGRAAGERKAKKSSTSKDLAPRGPGLLFDLAGGEGSRTGAPPASGAGAPSGADASVAGRPAPDSPAPGATTGAKTAARQAPLPKSKPSPNPEEQASLADTPLMMKSDSSSKSEPTTEKTAPNDSESAPKADSAPKSATSPITAQATKKPSPSASRSGAGDEAGRPAASPKREPAPQPPPAPGPVAGKAEAWEGERGAELDVATGGAAAGTDDLVESPREESVRPAKGATALARPSREPAQSTASFGAQLAARADGRWQPLASGAAVGPGDVVRAEVTSAAGGYAAVVVVDAGGQTSILVPTSSTRAAALTGERRLVGRGVTLRGRGPYRVYVLWSPASFDLVPILRGAKGQPARLPFDGEQRVWALQSAIPAAIPHEAAEAASPPDAASTAEPDR